MTPLEAAIILDRLLALAHKGRRLALSCAIPLDHRLFILHLDVLMARQQGYKIKRADLRNARRLPSRIPEMIDYLGWEDYVAEILEDLDQRQPEKN